MMLTVAFISDTHSLAKNLEVPDADVLVHCGDLCGNSKFTSFLEQVRWFAAFPHRHKIFVAGNHDTVFEDWPAVARGELESRGIVYLQDSSVEIEGVKFYGTPWQPEFNNWAFNIKEERKRELIWRNIPSDVDVLITHCPPNGVMDLCNDGHVGCEALWREVVYRIKPQVHAFGHVHEGYGTFPLDDILFVNAAICDGDYNPVNKPLVVKVEHRSMPVTVRVEDFTQPMPWMAGNLEAGPFYFNLINALVEGSPYAKRQLDLREQQDP